MKSSIKASVVAACLHLLAPVVRLLLHAGITYQEFADLGKRVYVDVASAEFGLQGRKTNLSRTSILTGIGRKEVGRLRKLAESDEIPFRGKMHPATRVMAKWHQLPAYLEASGSPRNLDETELLGLIEEHAGDIPPGALLKELQRVGAVRRNDQGLFEARERSFIPGEFDQDSIRMLGAHIHDLGSTISHNLLDRKPVRFQRVVSNESLDANTVRRLHKLISEQGEEWLETLDDWMSKHEQSGPDAGSKLHRAGIGIYFFDGIADQE